MADEVQPPRLLSDPQDPLPEANWLWRRVFTFAVLIAAFVIAAGLAVAINRIVGNIVGRIDSMDARNVAQITVVAINAILKMFTLMFYVVLANMLLYIVAPSAEQITKMLQTARLLRAGVQIASRAKAETPEGQREETQATIGLPPQPVVPPAAADTPAPAPEATSDEDFAPRGKA
jgi:hypothetical protein